MIFNVPQLHFESSFIRIHFFGDIGARRDRNTLFERTEHFSQFFAWQRVNRDKLPHVIQNVRVIETYDQRRRSHRRTHRETMARFAQAKGKRQFQQRLVFDVVEEFLSGQQRTIDVHVLNRVTRGVVMSNRIVPESSVLRALGTFQKVRVCARFGAFQKVRVCSLLPRNRPGSFFTSCKSYGRSWSSWHCTRSQ